MSKRTQALLILLLAALPSDVAARQLFGNPTLNIPISHAPGLGLQVQKVVFMDPLGPGAEDFTDKLVARFIDKNVTVVERTEVNALLREQNLSLSGAVDRTSAAAVGKILGPMVMIFVNMQRYTTDQSRVYSDWKDSKGNVHRTHTSRTKAFARVSIRSVDVATGRIFAAKVLEETPVLENKVDDNCCAEYPDPYEALDLALESVVTQAERMYLPWQSVEQVTFFDDSACNLKAAFNLLKAGDKEGAMNLSKRNIDVCRNLAKPNPKALSHAYYNVGTLHFLLGEYEPALQWLRQAQTTRADRKNVETIDVVSLAQREAATMQAVEDRLTIETGATDRSQQAAAAAESRAMMTNEDVLALVSAKVPTILIVEKIRTSTCRFDTSTSGIIALQKAGAPNEVVIAMMGCR